MVVEAIFSLVLLLALGLVIYGPWQWICTDMARQIAFEQRDAIFDMAREGRISFEDPAYRDIRMSIEGAIRFAHEMTLSRFIWLHLTRCNASPVGPEGDALPSVKQSLMRIKDETLREEIARHAHLALLGVGGAVFMRSPIGVLLLLIVGVPMLLIPFLKQKLLELGAIALDEANNAERVRAAF